MTIFSQNTIIFCSSPYLSILFTLWLLFFLYSYFISTIHTSIVNKYLISNDNNINYMVLCNTIRASCIHYVLHFLIQGLPIVISSHVNRNEATTNK